MHLGNSDSSRPCDVLPLNLKTPGSANPVGSSLGEVWLKRESALMPLSPGHVFTTNPLRYLWVARGSTPQDGR